MKKLMLALVMLVSITVNAQKPIQRNCFVDTLYNVCGVIYMNNYDDINSYHESDWQLFISPEDNDGEYMLAYFNDTDRQPKVYIYYMVGELARKVCIFTDKKTISNAEELVMEWEQ